MIRALHQVTVLVTTGTASAQADSASQGRQVGEALVLRPLSGIVCLIAFSYSPFDFWTVSLINSGHDTGCSGSSGLVSGLSGNTSLAMTSVSLQTCCVGNKTDSPFNTVWCMQVSVF